MTTLNKNVDCSHSCSKEVLAIVYKQGHETVVQEAAGVTVRMATITCPCGWARTITKMYKCLYCGVWFCKLCAEEHFGKTRKEYYKEKLNEKSN